MPGSYPPTAPRPAPAPWPSATGPAQSSSSTTSSANYPAVLHRNLPRSVEVLQEHRFRLRAQLRVLDDRIELEVDRHTEWIEISGADTNPSAIHHARLRVHHRALPFPDANPVGEQSAIVSAREHRHPRMVVALRHEDAHI